MLMMHKKGDKVYLLGILAAFLTLLVLAMPYWRVNDKIDSTSDMQYVTSVEGLWIRCTAVQGAYYLCDNFHNAMIGPGRK